MLPVKIKSSHTKPVISHQEIRLIIKSVSAFMWYFMGKIEGTLKKSWVANGQTIGNEGQVITPQSLIRRPWK